jgi:hypothetical protein
MRICLMLLAVVLLGSPAAALPGHLTNSEWVIAAQSAAFQAFVVRGEQTLSASVRGQQHTRKGFGVRLVNEDDVVTCRIQGGTCRTLWSRHNTHGFVWRDKVPPGRWAFLVENYENWIWPATISVDLVLE